jgi:hypothetical protein
LCNEVGSSKNARFSSWQFSIKKKKVLSTFDFQRFLEPWII